MNRRSFFNFLPMAAATSAASIATALTPAVRAEEIQGLTVTSEGSLIIQNCSFYSDGSAPCLTVKPPLGASS
jgi:hypothetical protein